MKKWQGEQHFGYAEIERLALSFDTSTTLSAPLRGNRATCTERRRSESRFNYRAVVGAASPTGEVSRDSVTKEQGRQRE